MKPPCVAVAWSGGRDSTALLHATLSTAKDSGHEVVALHVHHGLSPHADAWLAHCETQCERWRRRGWPVEFGFERLSGGPSTGQSVEAWARTARYRALRRLAMAHRAEVVLLAHHRRDQAETLLLQALRGAGVAGLAGMPRSAARDGVTWLRPWLQIPSSDIDAYVRRHRLAHVDDDSNADPRFARNRLRLNVWPVLSAAFPHAEAALADAATWAQQADACLSDLAQLDLRAIEGAKGLRVGDLRRLGLPRQSNALRCWLRERMGRPAEASLVERMLSELSSAGPHRWPTSAGEIRHYRGHLAYCAEPAPEAPATDPERLLSIKRAGQYRLPGWGGVLVVKRVRHGGVPLAWLAHLALQHRTGGERYQGGLGRPARSLKKQFQAAGVPPWARAAPLLFSGGQLVYVPGLGIDARAIALPGQAQVSLEWLPAQGTA